MKSPYTQVRGGLKSFDEREKSTIKFELQYKGDIFDSCQRRSMEALEMYMSHVSRNTFVVVRHIVSCRVFEECSSSKFMRSPVSRTTEPRVLVGARELREQGRNHG